MKDLKNIKTFDQLIEVEHGKIGTESRNTYEEKTQMFIISEMLKEARREAKITQEELAEKTGIETPIAENEVEDYLKQVIEEVSRARKKD